MQQSESIDQLSTALSKAQGEIQAAIKDKTNPHFRNNFASLQSVIDSLKGPFSKNGLSITQAPGQSEHGWILESQIMHASGQWIRCTFPLLVEKNTSQAFGSALSYARRYTLSSLSGTASDDVSDDDGEIALDAAGGTPKEDTSKRSPSQSNALLKPKSKEKEPLKVSGPLSQAISAANAPVKNELNEMVEAGKIKPDQIRAIISEMFAPKKLSSDLDGREFSDLIAACKKLAAETSN
jgi:hypothetical protein